MQFALLCSCFLLSGAAALIYQAAWARQFAPVFGTSELAVAAVLAAYMAGLALGARAVRGLLPRVRRALRWYALLELGIGASAVLLVPVVMAWAHAGLVAGFGGQPAPPPATLSLAAAWQLGSAFAALAVPTALMGATLPLLARDAVRADEQVGPRIGALYATNTVGAVFGALAGSLWLLPRFGLAHALLAAAALNGLVALLALALDRARSLVPVAAAPGAAATPSASAGTGNRAGAGPRRLPLLLPLVALSGAVAFVHEVLWTRLLERLVGGSVQAFGVMLAAFLGGIAIGGALGAWRARTRDAARALFALAQGLVALAALLAWIVLVHLDPAGWGYATRIGAALALLLPLAIGSGMTWPLAVRAVASSHADAAAASARAYAWNTAGAIAGAILAGWWLLPALRYEGTLQALLVASVALGAAAGLPVAWRSRHRRAAIACAAVALVLAAGFHPAPPEAWLRVSPLRPATGPLLYYGVGRSADVTATRSGGVIDLRTNGLPEAGIPLDGAAPAATAEGLMGALGVLARPQARSALVIGLGGGNALAGLPPTLAAIDVIELEPEVVAANRAVSGWRGADPLADARVHVIANDARGALALTNQSYDLVVSQPSHPWTAGASHLYTREFLELVHARLAPGGVYVGWMGGRFVDAPLLRSLLATFLSAFQELRVYRSGSDSLLFLAGDAPLEPESRASTAIGAASEHYARLGINVPEDVAAGLVLDTTGARALAGDAAPTTDDDNRLALARWPRIEGGLQGAALGALFLPEDPLPALAASGLDRVYLARQLLLGADDSARARVAALAARLEGTADGAALRYLLARERDDGAGATTLLGAALERWPGDATLRWFAAERALGQPATAARAGAPPPRTALPPGAALALGTLALANRQDWDAVRARDAALADVPWAAPWSALAQQLRVEWRLRVANQDLRPALAEQGIALCDRRLAAGADPLWHALRALSAEGGGRPEAQLESIGAYAESALAHAGRLAPAERSDLRQRAALLAPYLERLAGRHGIDADRLEEIRATLARVAALP